MNIDIHIIINMNIECYIDYYILLKPIYVVNININNTYTSSNYHANLNEPETLLPTVQSGRRQ